jgi:hypothetical protein
MTIVNVRDMIRSFQNQESLPRTACAKTTKRRSLWPPQVSADPSQAPLTRVPSRALRQARPSNGPVSFASRRAAATSGAPRAHGETQRELTYHEQCHTGRLRHGYPRRRVPDGTICCHYPTEDVAELVDGAGFR